MSTACHFRLPEHIVDFLKAKAERLSKKRHRKVTVTELVVKALIEHHSIPEPKN